MHPPINKIISFFIILALCSCASKVQIKQEDSFKTAQDTAIQTPQEKSQDEQDKPKSIPTETNQATSLHSWIISGGLAAKNKNKGWSATINWKQNGSNDYQIRLLGPLGGGSVLVEKRGGKIILRDGPKEITASNAEELFKKETGVSLPVGHLYYWARGLPAPGSSIELSKTENGLLQLLKQNGYTIQYQDYTHIKTYHLPRKIRLEGHGLLMKLIIRRWNI